MLTRLYLCLVVLATIFVTFSYAQVGRARSQGMASSALGSSGFQAQPQLPMFPDSMMFNYADLLGMTPPTFGSSYEAPDLIFPDAPILSRLIMGQSAVAGAQTERPEPASSESFLDGLIMRQLGIIPHPNLLSIPAFTDNPLLMMFCQQNPQMCMKIAGTMLNNNYPPLL